MCGHAGGKEFLCCDISGSKSLFLEIKIDEKSAPVLQGFPCWHVGRNDPEGIRSSGPATSYKVGLYLEPQGQPFINGCFNWMMNQIFI